MRREETTSFFFVGEQLAGLQLLRPLRIRALSEIWYAARLDSGAPVAIKFLRQDNPRRDRFDDIAALLQRRESPFLIHVFEHGEIPPGMPYAVMEYTDGGTLRRRLEHGIFPFSQAIHLLRSMLLALTELHHHGVVHRDIKPDNIWFVSDGGIRLGDFGLAKLPGFPEEPGGVFGTASYMSPEQARDSTAVDCRSDLYSLALVLFEVLTGRRFREKADFTVMLKRILSDRSEPPIDLLRAAATEKLAQLLGRMMEYSPALRPGSPAEALAELDAMELPGGESPFNSHPSVSGNRS